MASHASEVESPSRTAVATPSPEEDESAPLLDSAKRPQDVPRRLVVMPILWLCAFLSALDLTIVASCYAEIGSEFQRLNLVVYVSTAYLVTNTASQPLCARISDIFGRRAALVGAHVLFSSGTLLCGFAPNIWALVAGRALAGLGGGGLATLSSVVTSDVVPLRERATWQGYTGVFWGIGASIGGPLGGLITDTIGWRWAFHMQIPLSVLAAIATWHYIHLNPKVHEGKGHALGRIDFLGSLALTATVSLLLLGLNLGGNEFEWSSPVIILLLSFALASLVLFLVVEGYFAREPMLPLRLFRSRTPIGVALGNLVTAMVAFSALYNVPLWLNVINGLDSSQAGARLIPLVLGSTVGTLGSGILMRRTGRYRLLMLIGGFGLETLASAGLATFATVNTPSSVLMVFLGLMGMSYGISLITTLIAIISAVAIEDTAVATGFTYLFRSLGSVFGISLTQVVLQNILKSLLQQRITGPGSAEIITRVRASVIAIRDYPEFEGVIVASYVGALRACFLLTLAFAILGLASSFLVQEYKLHTTLDRTEES